MTIDETVTVMHYAQDGCYPDMGTAIFDGKDAWLCPKCQATIHAPGWDADYGQVGRSA